MGEQYAGVDPEETKRKKAYALRRRKPLVKDINLESIKNELYDILEYCENVKWYCDSDDGADSLTGAMVGDEEDEHELRMMFSDLAAETEQMLDDMEWTYIPDCFDVFFVAIGAGAYGGGILGYDEYEGDYFGLDCTDEFVEKESAKRLMRLTKQQLIDAAQACMKIFCAYVGLRNRYDNLSASLDILKDRNTGQLQLVEHINEAYEKAAAVEFCGWKRETKEFYRLIADLPAIAWVF